MDFKIGLQAWSEAFASVSMQSKQRIRDARTTKNTWHSKNGYKDKWGRVSDHSIRNAVWAPPPTWLFVKFQNDKQKKIFKKMMIRGNCRLLLRWMEFFFSFGTRTRPLLYKIMQRPEWLLFQSHSQGIVCMRSKLVDWIRKL